jgi:hypothetical protein
MYICNATVNCKATEFNYLPSTGISEEDLHEYAEHIHKDPPRSCRRTEANMKQIKKCIVVVSNLNGSVAMDCKVI